MDDISIEQTVTGRRQLKLIIIRNLLTAIGIFFIMTSTVMIFLLPLGPLFLYLAYCVNNANKTQYDYIIVNDEFEVARIMNFNKRKVVFKGNFNDLELVAKNNKELVNRYRLKKVRIYNFLSPDMTKRQIALVFKSGLNYACVLTVLDDRLIKAIKMRANYLVDVKE